MGDTVMIELDMFPMIAYTPLGGRYEPSRVILVDGQAQVWYAEPGGQPTKVFEGAYLSQEGNSILGYTILLHDGQIVATPGAGCGCGPGGLRSFDPFNGATRRLVG